MGRAGSASAAVQAATTRSSTLLYARPAFLSIPLGSLGTVAVRAKPTRGGGTTCHGWRDERRATWRKWSTMNTNQGFVTRAVPQSEMELAHASRRVADSPQRASKELSNSHTPRID